MDIPTLVSSFTSSPVPAMLVIALFAVGYLYRAREADAKAHATELAAQNAAHLEAVRKLYEAHLEAMQKQTASHFATAMQVVPLASKLAECVSLFERVVLPRAGAAS